MTNHGPMKKGLHTRHRPLWGWFAVAVAVGILAAACGLSDDISDDEMRIQQLNKAIMCPRCPGESIDQSQNQLSAQMRAIVSEQVREGRSDEQIKAFFVERFSPSVLMEPPQRGFSLLVWLLPPAGVVSAIVLLILALRVMRRSANEGPDDVPETVSLSDAERSRYFARLEAVLDYEESDPTPPKDRNEEGGSPGLVPDTDEGAV